jgi:hypothetical protein
MATRRGDGTLPVRTRSARGRVTAPRSCVPCSKKDSHRSFEVPAHLAKRERPSDSEHSAVGVETRPLGLIEQIAGDTKGRQAALPASVVPVYATSPLTRREPGGRQLSAFAHIVRDHARQGRGHLGTTRGARVVAAAVLLLVEAELDRGIIE